MKVVLSGNENRVKAFLKKERLWMKRKGVKTEKFEDADSSEIEDAIKVLNEFHASEMETAKSNLETATQDLLSKELELEGVQTKLTEETGVKEGLVLELSSLNDSKAELQGQLDTEIATKEEAVSAISTLEDAKSKLESDLATETAAKEKFKADFNAKKMEVLNLQNKVKKLESKE